MRSHAEWARRQVWGYDSYRLWASAKIKKRLYQLCAEKEVFVKAVLDVNTGHVHNHWVLLVCDANIRFSPPHLNRNSRAVIYMTTACCTAFWDMPHQSVIENKLLELITFLENLPRPITLRGFMHAIS